MVAVTKDAKTKLNATSLRESTEAKRTALLSEKRTDLLEAKRSLKARELVNPRKIKELRREIALIMTVEKQLERTQEEESR